MTPRWIWPLLFLVPIFLLTGCWNKDELNELVLISAIGVDWTPEGGYRFSFQVVNPENSAGGLQGGTGPGAGTTVTIYSAKGESVMEASRHATSQISRKMFFSQANLIVISEELAKNEGLLPVLEVFDRDIELRASTNVVIARDTTAEALLGTVTSGDRIPAVEIRRTLQNTEDHLGESMKVNIQETISNIISHGRNAIIPGFVIAGEDGTRASKIENIESTIPAGILEAKGLGILKDGKLIDWFEHDESTGTLFLLNKINESFVNIDWEGKKSVITYEIIREKTKVKAYMKNGVPEIHVHVRTKGNISEASVPVHLKDTIVLEEIERKAEKKIKGDLKLVIKKAKENKTDVLGFGEVLHRSNPKYWHKVKENWHDVHFPDLSVKITVDPTIKHTGLRNIPFLYQMENR